jgi:hypothetical protein
MFRVFRVFLEGSRENAGGRSWPIRNELHKEDPLPLKHSDHSEHIRYITKKAGSLRDSKDRYVPTGTRNTVGTRRNTLKAFARVSDLVERHEQRRAMFFAIGGRAIAIAWLGAVTHTVPRMGWSQAISKR